MTNLTTCIRVLILRDRTSPYPFLLRLPFAPAIRVGTRRSRALRSNIHISLTTDVPSSGDSQVMTLSHKPQCCLTLLGSEAPIKTS